MLFARRGGGGGQRGHWDLLCCAWHQSGCSRWRLRSCPRPCPADRCPWRWNCGSWRDGAVALDRAAARPLRSCRFRCEVLPELGVCGRLVRAASARAPIAVAALVGAVGVTAASEPAAATTRLVGPTEGVPPNKGRLGVVVPRFPWPAVAVGVCRVGPDAASLSIAFGEDAGCGAACPGWFGWRVRGTGGGRSGPCVTARGHGLTGPPQIRLAIARSPATA